jgi:hypothetical protein
VIKRMGNKLCRNPNTNPIQGPLPKPLISLAPSIALPSFKKFTPIENLESFYSFSAKIPSKPDQALYTKAGGGFNTKFLIKTISKATSRSFTPEEKK